MGKIPARAFDVVIIGYGPVGALLGLMLGQRGHRVAVLDRAGDVVPHPRAVHFDAEVMRLFQRVGIEEALSGCTVPVEGMHFVNDEGQVIFRFDAAPQQGPLGWHEGYMFHQPDLERVLRTAVASVPGVTVCLSHDVVSITDHESDARVVAQTGGGEVALSGRFVVGCDGGRSSTRTAIGAAMRDYECDRTWLVLDLLLERPVDLPRTTVQYCEVARPSTYVRTPGRRRRFEFMQMPGDRVETLLTPAFQAELLRRWLDPRDYTIERAAAYEFHGVVADRWRSGHVLIAGDAAHQMPPFLGQGMCAGLRDVANLEWKLDLVLRGVAHASLLDTYMSERKPNVERVIEDDITLGGLIQTTSPEGARARDAMALRDGRPTPLAPKAYVIGAGLCADAPPARLPFPQPRLADGTLHDRRLDRGFALVGAVASASTLPARLAALSATHVHEPEPAIADWLSRTGATAAVVRPDAIVLGVASTPQELDGVLDPIGAHLR